MITFQAARILGYRLVELRSGQNPLSIPMTAQLAPNFELAVAVMTDEADQKDSAGKRAFPPGQRADRRAATLISTWHGHEPAARKGRFGRANGLS